MTALWTMLAAAVTAAAQPLPAPAVTIEGARPKWVEHFGTEHTDWVNRAIELPNGRIVAAGFLNRDDRAKAPDWNAVLEGYDGQGRRIWSQSWGGQGVEAAWSVQARADGSFVIGGLATEAPGGDLNAALTITDERSLNTVHKSFGGRGDDRATDAILLSDGGILLIGQTDTSGAGGIDVFVNKTTADGTEEWGRTYGTPTDDRGFFGVAMPDGGAVIGGVTGPRGSYDLLLMRIAADGSEVWKRVVSGSGNDATHGVARLSDGRIMLTGYGPSWGGRDNDVSVLIFDDAGTLVSHRAIGGAGDDRVQFVAADPSGGAWLTGYTKSFSPHWKMLVARVGPGGEIEPWLGALGGIGDMNGSTVAVARDGDLILGGYSALPSGGKAPPDAFLMRVAPEEIVQLREGVSVRTVPTKCVKVSAAEQRCA